MNERRHQAITEDRLKQLPSASGVYLMKDEEGEVLYVGKAKNLRSRVRSYFSGGDNRLNIPYLLERIRSIETLVTENERQAIVLEQDLIKKYKPRYNVRLKDDRAPFVVRIDMNAEWPRIELVRSIADDGAKYIGPFAYSYELRSLLDVIRNTIPLRTCSDAVLRNRVRPCLEYQIKRCAAPCCLDVDPAQYLEWVEQAISILEGRNKDVAGQLERQMERASRELRFEDAAAIRDRLEVLNSVGADEHVVRFKGGSRDAFGLMRDGSQAEVSILAVRRGRLYESRTFGFSEVEEGDEELLGSVLMQYYAGCGDLPDEIFVPLELEDAEARSEVLSEMRGRKTVVRVPERGSGKRLLLLAGQNAEQNYKARFLGGAGGDEPLHSLQSALELEQAPRTIACVDISHFQGGETVASVVFFKDAVADKARYRRFRLPALDKPDDFEAMRQVVERYLSRTAEENELPDLMIIDGGAGQLSQALQVRRALGLDRPQMVGLAKKRTVASGYREALLPAPKPERVFLERGQAPVVLKPGSAALHLIERIRDEAHRFAVTFHRERRSRRTFASALDAIQGVGEKRRVALLREFGSVQAIREASPEELSSRCRIPQRLAERIIATLKLRAGGGADGS